MTGAVTPHNYVPQDRLYLWALVNPAQPVLVGELRLSQLVADCATFAYAPPWWNFALSEDLHAGAGANIHGRRTGQRARGH